MSDIYNPLCTDYSFKREVRVHIVTDNETIRHRLDISEINFGQTFMEHSYSNKSIQNPYMFEQSVINKANPATFDVTFPALREDDLRILFDKALDYSTFNLYVQAPQGLFKIENCVVSNASLIIENSIPLSMSVSGEASKVSLLPLATPPGILVPRSANQTYNRISDLSITLDVSNVLSTSLASVTVELQNDIIWNPYASVNSAVNNTVVYPVNYTVKKRILAGTIVRYLVDEDIADTFNLENPLIELYVRGHSAR